jgi:hypothetical protein
VVPHLSSTTVPSHPTLYRLNMWSSWVRRMGTTQVMYIAKLKDGAESVTKTFSMVWKRFLKWYDGGGEWNHIKRFFDVEVFSSSQNIDFPFYLNRFLELFSLSLSFQYFFFLFPSLSFLYALSLEDLGVLMILEEKNHFFKNFFSNEMAWTH